MKRKNSLGGAIVATIRAALVSAESAEWERAAEWVKRATEMLHRKAAGQ